MKRVLGLRLLLVVFVVLGGFVGVAWGDVPSYPKYCDNDPLGWTTIQNGICESNRLLVQVGTFYSSESAAAAAVQAAGYNCAYFGCWWVATGIGQCAGYHCSNVSTACGHPELATVGSVYWYASGSYNSTLCLVDSDDDGIDDSIDPYPDDGSPFKFKRWYEIYDENGVLKAFAIKTDRGDIFWYGDDEYATACLAGENSCKTKMLISMGAEYPSDGSELPGMVGSHESAGDPSSGGVGGTVSDGELQVTPASGIESGVTSESGDSDSTLLSKIANNTAKTASNLQAVADRLKAVENEIRNVGVQGGLGAGSGTGTSETAVASGVASGITSTDEAREAAAESQSGSDMSGISGVNAGSYPTEGYDEGDVPDKNLLSDVYDNWLSNNPLTTLVGATGVSLSNATCSFSVEVDFGGQSRNIAFSLCDYEDALDTMGSLVYGLAVLSGIILLLTGKI